MINKRVFGSEIPVKVKKKLEARQLVAKGGKNPTDEINPSRYPDSEPDFYKYNELISSNFDMQADLSSRTPFARMWCGVSLVNELEFDIKDGDSSNSSKDGASAEENKNNYLQYIQKIHWRHNKPIPINKLYSPKNMVLRMILINS